MKSDRQTGGSFSVLPAFNNEAFAGGHVGRLRSTREIEFQDFFDQTEHVL